MALSLTAAPGLENTQAAPLAAPGLTAQAAPPLTRDYSPAIEGWLAPDMRSGSIDWSAFTPLPSIDYANLLNRQYKISGKGVAAKNLPPPLPGQRAGMEIFGMGLPEGAVYKDNLGLTPDALKYKDPQLAAAIDALNAKAYAQTHPEQVDISSGLGALNNFQMRDAPYVKRDSTLDTTPVLELKRILSAPLAPKAPEGFGAYSLHPGMIKSSIDPAAETKRLLNVDSTIESLYQQTAKETGMSVEQLKDAYGRYTKAYNSLVDPVGANWQDLKATGSLYSDSLLPGIRRYSGYGDGFYNQLSSQVSEGTRNSQKYLSPEYFALHGVTEDMLGKPGTFIGMTNPNRNGAILTGRKKVGIEKTNPYLMQDWTDYLSDTENMLTATPDQKSAAETAMAQHTADIRSKVADGGQFRIWDEAGVNPRVTTKVKGGKWKPKNSAYTNELNIAENYLGTNTQGEKSYKDAGFSPDTAWQSGFYFKPKQKKGFLGGGLGTILSLASFIPGPVGIGARIASAVNSIASGDILGGAMAALGAMGGSNPIASLGSKISSATGIPLKAANMMVSGGIGGLNALSKGGNFGTGVLGSVAGNTISDFAGNTMLKAGISPEASGATAGALGSMANAAINGSKGAIPLALAGASGAMSGYGRGANLRKKAKVR